MDQAIHRSDQNSSVNSESQSSDLYASLPLCRPSDSGQFNAKGELNHRFLLLQGFFKRFSTGLLIQLLLHFSGSPLRFIRQPTLFFRTLNRNVLNLGKFFGFYCAIYRVRVTFALILFTFSSLSLV